MTLPLQATILWVCSNVIEGWVDSFGSMCKLPFKSPFPLVRVLEVPLVLGEGDVEGDERLDCAGEDCSEDRLNSQRAWIDAATKALERVETSENMWRRARISASEGSVGEGWLEVKMSRAACVVVLLFIRVSFSNTKQDYLGSSVRG